MTNRMAMDCSVSINITICTALRSLCVMVLIPGGDSHTDRAARAKILIKPLKEAEVTYFKLKVHITVFKSNFALLIRSRHWPEAYACFVKNNIYIMTNIVHLVV